MAENSTLFDKDYTPTDNEPRETQAMSREDLIDAMMHDVVGIDNLNDENFHGISDTIKDILHDYHLSTDMSFIEKIAQIKFPKTGESLSVEDIPKELNDAAFLPVNTLSDIALRQDIDMLLEDASVPSYDGNWKIYILDECHMLSKTAQNRLLKSLEEPVERVLMILCTTNPEDLLPSGRNQYYNHDCQRL